MNVFFDNLHKTSKGYTMNKTGLQPILRPVEQSFGCFRKVPKNGANV